MINLYLPDFFYNFRIIRKFINLQENSPELFYEDRIIKGVYGSFPSLIWSLDRDIVSCGKNMILNIIDFYRNNNINIEYFFINPIISYDLLQDEDCNYVLSMIDSTFDSVILNSKLLELHIKNYNKDICIKYFNYENDIFISDNKMNKFFFLNNICDNNCNLFKQHIEYLGNEQTRRKPLSIHFPCCLSPSVNFYDVLDKKSSYLNNQLNSFSNNFESTFYISSNFLSRNLKKGYSSFDYIESFLYYLIKTEYVNKTRLIVINQLIEERKF